MSQYLTEGTKFICKLGGSITCKESIKTKISLNGRTGFLTEKAKVSSCQGICTYLSSLQQKPTECSCHLTQWIFTENSAKCKGDKILLSSCRNMCIYPGGFISVMSSGCDYVETGASSADGVGNGANILMPLKIEVKNPNETRLEYAPEEARPAISPGSAVGGKETLEKSDECLKENLLCPLCKGAENCKYVNTSIDIENNSGLLRKNYNLNNPNDDVDKYCLEQIEENKQYTFAAHHIISGNQVFKQFPEIVRLANFCEYDINNALNCILLVSKQDEYGKQSETMKSVSAYEAMSDTGLQWHLGGHSYKFTKDDIDNIKRIEYLSRQKVKGGLKNYAELLREELQKIQLNLETNKVCRNSPQQRSAFIKRMNNLSKKVKEKLGAFRFKRRDSFPYYVSKTAFDFTFNLPRTGKVMVVRANNNCICLSRYRVERFIKGENNGTGKDIKFLPKVGSTGIHMRAFGLADVNDIHECIEFCDNIQHFIYLPSMKTVGGSLPFTPQFVFDLGIEYEDDNELFAQKSNELLVWLRDNQADEYIAPVKMIRQRIKEADK